MTSLRVAPRETARAISVVVPVHNEAENLSELAAEVVAALRGKAVFEIVFVDDGSTDGTALELARLKALYPELRPVAHDRKSGQSIAVVTGARAARGETIVTIDGDGQNDPNFILELAQTLAAGRPQIGLVAGRRLGRK
ncbi:MAG: glycosyltransferase family 2 protein, partial [Pseudorhodoplanes sp.]